ncbi:DoxX family protein [Granulicoccus phenolivorans]|uniref:DoxX family protein n=1 Tax=Granulicoccus phenolivorans TaxID=266854 RepID=UPI000418173F|nr:DoxX family protein [Granulicoccus phenolivorans]
MIKFIARSLLSGVFITGGLSAVKDPGGRPGMVQKSAQSIGIDLDDKQAELLVRVNGGVMVGAGATLALGILPRLSAAALICSLIPTTLAGHAFWTYDDPGVAAQHKGQFFKNLSSIGGLLYVVATGKAKKSDD